MVDVDVKAFNRVYVETFEALPHPGKDFNEKTMAVYFEALREYELCEVLTAFKICQKNCDYFPVPKKLIEAIEGKEDEVIDCAFINAKKAIEKIGYHDSICFKDRLTMLTIQDMGGLQKFHNKLFREEKEDSAYFEFKRSYRRYLRMYKNSKEQPGIKKLMGYTEGMGGIYKIAFWSEKLEGVKEIIPNEWRPYILSNREAFAKIRGETAKKIENSKPMEAESIDDLIKLIGFEKL